MEPHRWSRTDSVESVVRDRMTSQYSLELLAAQPQQANIVAVTLSTRHGMTLSYGWCKVVNESFYTP